MIKAAIHSVRFQGSALHRCKSAWSPIPTSIIGAASDAMGEKRKFTADGANGRFGWTPVQIATARNARAAHAPLQAEFL